MDSIDKLPIGYRIVIEANGNIHGEVHFRVVLLQPTGRDRSEVGFHNTHVSQVDECIVDLCVFANAREKGYIEREERKAKRLEANETVDG